MSPPRPSMPNFFATLRSCFVLPACGLARNPFTPTIAVLLKPSGPYLEAGPLSQPYLGIVPRACLRLVTARKDCVRLPSRARLLQIHLENRDARDDLSAGHFSCLGSLIAVL